MIEPKDQQRRSQFHLLDALKGTGIEIRNPKSFRCPFHDDANASAGVYEDDEGVWRFKCQAASCGLNLDVYDVIEKTTGETVESQLSSIREAHRPKEERAKRYDSIEKWKAANANVVAIYPYTNPDTGVIELLKMRIENEGHKTFKQAHANAKGEVIECAPAHPHPLFNRGRIRNADTVIVVEGEKCVEYVTRAGLTATCVPGGGGHGTAAKANWAPLAGKTVILWPDHDPIKGDGTRGGHEHMRECASQIKMLSPSCSIWWLNPDDLRLGDKEDVADYLDRFPKEKWADAMSDAIDLALPMGGASELQEFMQDVIAGKRSNVAFPFRELTKSTRALLPGTITVLVGDPGSTKSMLMVQCLWWWRRRGVNVAAYMLEDDRRFHLQRILAQIDGNADLTDDEWIRQYGPEVLSAMDRHREELDALSKIIFDCPDDTPDYKQILMWMQRVCDGGARVIVVDPITAVDAGKHPWDSDREFMAKAKAILRRHGVSLILVTHPRSSNNKTSHDDAAGSRAFGRFCQSMLWIKRCDPAARTRVKTPIGDAMHITDRIIVLVKVRNGRGQGVRLAYQFNCDNLQFIEQGMLVRIVKDKDGESDD